MSRTCIICGANARSREHLFPAALGGRREHKGIYCHEHNQAFGFLVDELANQFRFINSQLEVIGDRSSTVVEAPAIDMATGEAVRVTASTLRFDRPADIQEVLTSSGIVRTATFYRRAEAEAWAKAERSQGRTKIKWDKTAEKHYSKRLHATQTFGGPLGLRAMAYIVQSFFAQAFPELSRTPALDALKNYTLRGDGPHLAWWTFEPIAELGANRFEFGHRVVVGIDGLSGRAFGQISLFSTFHVTVEIGALGEHSSACHVTDIDPLAACPPDDIHVRSLGGLATPATPEPDPIGSLTRAIHSGYMATVTGELMQRIERRQQHQAAQALHDALLPLAALSNEVRAERILAVTEEYAGYVLKLLDHFVECMDSGTQDPVQMALAKASQLVMARDTTQPHALTPMIHHVMGLVMHAMARRFDDHLSAGTLTVDSVEALLCHGEGAAFAGRWMLGAVFGPQFLVGTDA